LSAVLTLEVDREVGFDKGPEPYLAKMARSG